MLDSGKKLIHLINNRFSDYFPSTSHDLTPLDFFFRGNIKELSLCWKSLSYSIWGERINIEISGYADIKRFRIVGGRLFGLFD